MDTYEKKYNEALERAKELIAKWTGKNKDFYTEDYAYIFPELHEELRESENERIINQLIALVNSAGEVLLIPTNKEELIAWLNKCKESLHVSEMCKENDDSFTSSNEDERIRKAIVEHFEAFSPIKLFGKKGTFTRDQVLAYLEKQKNLMPPTNVDPCDASWYAYYRRGLNKGYELGKQEQKPVETSDFKTKLAAYLQNNSPKDGQYVISSESILEMAKEELIKRGELQKPVAWSEKDEKIKERLITRLNWITYNTRTDGTSPNITFFDEIAWLKSLRPSWKPTEEQMKALNWARCLIFETYTDKHIATEPYHILGELYDQLKQLKDGNGTVHP